ncbi:DNA cytosine methyltransferase [Roseibium sediminicola]|uniref:DNA (cytosine-5-)-methyltransferase n=1 Tax=Roseibium sediminicola TaxID=2933272 RepID=A0ABT0GSD7_9HYPH|nr:DNA cytosine methyltransferase [Roseibium sp. CAU 1639]MCK7611982.1 DNA cytosine methyltransferase [Roseibium sp. CAU 1639]
MLVADLLCGAGGSSTGCRHALDALGLEMELVCVNHWPTAIETHQINHPNARHFVQDIATVRPHLLVPEGYLDLLMASPTCTHHSVARGGKPTSDQQRSDPWHIITWLTELRVKRMIIENVWEFISWGPVNAQTGKPVKSRRGEYFHAWIQTIRGLGFEPEWRKLNAADFGDATSRQRFILMARSDGKKVIWPMPTNRKISELKDDLFAVEKPWRPAWEIIDWNLKGKSIFGRSKPLAPKTLLRIYAGAVKFGWPEPFLRLLLAEIENSLRFHIRWFFSVRNRKPEKKARAKRRAVVRKNIQHLREFLASPVGFANGGKSTEPLIITLRQNASGTPIDQPIPTLAANGQHVGLASPVVVNMKGKSTAGSAFDPLPTQTAHAPHLFTAEPVIMNGRKGNQAKPASTDPLPTLDTKGGVWLAEPMVMSYYGNTEWCHSPEDPLATITAKERHAVVEPFVLSQASGGAPRSTEEPIPTQTTGGNGASHALISPYYSSGSGETCQSADDSLPTVTSKGRFAMAVPVTNSNGGAQARDVRTAPLPTMTTAKGGEFALVETGPEYDILFRMLEPHELAAAMGLEGYKFAGTKTDQIKQIGNAVSRRKIQACVTAIMSDAAPAGQLMEAAE